jgi:hypothetical protein
MHYIIILTVVLTLLLSLPSALTAQGAAGEMKKEQKAGERSSSAERGNSNADINEGGSWALRSMPDEKFELQDAVIHGTPFRWLMLSSSYLLVPSPGWFSNQYGASMLTSMKLTDELRLMYRLQYSYYRTTRDEDFPERLQKWTNYVVLGGGWFQVGVGASNKSDVLFKGFNTININASVNFQVWHSGHHSILLGAIFSSKAELWKSVLPLPTFAYRFVMPGLFISAGIPMLLVWRPDEHISLDLTGMLPGVGSMRLQFKIQQWLSLSLQWVRRIEPFYLHSYPIRDLGYLEYSLKEILNYQDERAEGKKFILASQRAGIGLAFNLEDYVTISLYNGLQFNASYYLTDNILARKTDGKRIANAYIFEASVRGVLYKPSDMR